MSIITVRGSRPRRWKASLRHWPL